MGFVRAGYKSAIAVDIDKAVLAVHERNLKTPTLQADLSFPEQVDNYVKGCDVLIAGSPCQGFSTIGKRRFDDPRNELLLVTGRLAVKHRPKLVVAENVPAVASGKHKQYWEALHGILADAGYQTVAYRCDSSTMGVAQKRIRMFLVAWNTGKDLLMPLPTAIGGSLGDALSGAEGLPNHAPELLDPSSSDYAIAKRLQPGQKLSNVRSGPRAVHTWDIPEVFGRTNKAERAALEDIVLLRRRFRIREYGDADPIQSRVMHKLFGKELVADLERKGYLRRVENCYDLVGTFNGKFRRPRLDQPSPTVDTRFGDPRCFLHPSEHRGFSVREAARIQGFPDNFIFSGTRAEQYRMVGNAVPPPMATLLAKHLKKILGL